MGCYQYTVDHRAEKISQNYSTSARTAGIYTAFNE